MGWNGRRRAGAICASPSTGGLRNATTIATALVAIRETVHSAHDLAKVVSDASGELAARTTEISSAMDALFKTASLDGGIKKLARFRGASGAG